MITRAVTTAMTINIIGWPSFTKPKIVAAMIRIMIAGLIHRFLGFCIWSTVFGFTMSCISCFAFRFEQQAPQSARYSELLGSALRRGHFLRLQDVEHQHPARDRENQFGKLARRLSIRRVLPFR